MTWVTVNFSLAREVSWLCLGLTAGWITQLACKDLLFSVKSPAFSHTQVICEEKEDKLHLCQIWPMLNSQSIAPRLSALLGLGGVCFCKHQWAIHCLCRLLPHGSEWKSYFQKYLKGGHRRFMALDMFVLFNLFSSSWQG